MRSLLPLFLLIAACAHSAVPSNSDGQPIRPSDPAPAAIEAAAAHVAVVYTETDCKHLDQATGRGVGFWVTPRIVVTAGHAMDHRLRTFPDFAIVGPDGRCIEGQYGDWREEFDLLFILTHGRHEGHLTLDERLPAADERAYQLSYEARDAKSGRVAFSRRALRVEKIPDSKVYFGATPTPRQGDSGSPIVDARGNVLGITLAIGSYKDDPDRRPIGVYMTSLVIRLALGECGPCEEE